MSQAVRFPGGYPAEERLYVLRALAMQAYILYTLVYVHVNVNQPSTCLSDKYFIYLSFHPHRYDACPYHNMHAPTKRPQPINMHRNLYTGHIT